MIDPLFGRLFHKSFIAPCLDNIMNNCSDKFKTDDNKQLSQLHNKHEDIKSIPSLSNAIKVIQKTPV